MSNLDVLVIGVGDAFSARHSTSALILESGGFRLAVDCPDRYRGVLRAASALAGRALDLDAVEDFLITHVHGDHVNGLEGVAFFKHFAEGKKVRLATSVEVAGVLWEKRLVASMGQLWDGTAYRTMHFEDYFETTPLRWGVPEKIGPFQVVTRRTLHHVPTSALLVSVGDRSVGISSDTAFDPGLIQFLSQANLVIHETNHGPAHTDYARLRAAGRGERQDAAHSLPGRL